jgi:hypothetical protein
VENLREHSGILFVNNEKNVRIFSVRQHKKFEGKCGSFFVDSLENLREKLQYFLLIM